MAVKSNKRDRFIVKLESIVWHVISKVVTPKIQKFERGSKTLELMERFHLLFHPSFFSGSALNVGKK